jgi:hypothetical protein
MICVDPGYLINLDISAGTDDAHEQFHLDIPLLVVGPDLSGPPPIYWRDMAIPQIQFVLYIPELNCLCASSVPAEICPIRIC